MIDTLLSSALNDSEISHEEFTNNVNEVKELLQKLCRFW